MNLNYLNKEILYKDLTFKSPNPFTKLLNGNAILRLAKGTDYIYFGNKTQFEHNYFKGLSLGVNWDIGSLTSGELIFNSNIATNGKGAWVRKHSYNFASKRYEAVMNDGKIYSFSSNLPANGPWGSQAVGGVLVNDAGIPTNLSGALYTDTGETSTETFSENSYIGAYEKADGTMVITSSITDDSGNILGPAYVTIYWMSSPTASYMFPIIETTGYYIQTLYPELDVVGKIVTASLTTTWSTVSQNSLPHAAYGYKQDINADHSEQLAITNACAHPNKDLVLYYSDFRSDKDSWESANTLNTLTISNNKLVLTRNALSTSDNFINLERYFVDKKLTKGKTFRITFKVKNITSANIETFRCVINASPNDDISTSGTYKQISKTITPNSENLISIDIDEFGDNSSTSNKIRLSIDFASALAVDDYIEISDIKLYQTNNIITYEKSQKGGLCGPKVGVTYNSSTNYIAEFAQGSFNTQLNYISPQYTTDENLGIGATSEDWNIINSETPNYNDTSVITKGDWSAGVGVSVATTSIDTINGEENVPTLKLTTFHHIGYQPGNKYFYCNKNMFLNESKTLPVRYFNKPNAWKVKYDFWLKKLKEPAANANYDYVEFGINFLRAILLESKTMPINEWTHFKGELDTEVPATTSLTTVGSNYISISCMPYATSSSSSQYGIPYWEFAKVNIIFEPTSEIFAPAYVKIDHNKRTIDTISIYENNQTGINRQRVLNHVNNI